MIKAQTLKGFRDFLPDDAIKRQYVIGEIKKVFERFGFDPLETPALEYAETLLGKYGDEADKLLYLFDDRGGRRVGMRYDQTVPLARVVAQYAHKLPLPFKRYQIQPVWRAENPQKGRYREFLQCDADIIGDNNPYLADAEILALFWSIYNTLGFQSFTIKVNSRKVLRNILSRAFGVAIENDFDAVNSEKYLAIMRVIDKLPKVGREAVSQELKMSLNLADHAINGLFDDLSKLSTFRYTSLKQLDEGLYWSLQMAIENFKVPEKSIIFDPTLARGLDYYTGIIFEGFDQNYKSSLGGGGRYDNLIGQFLNKNKSVPAIGFAVGFDRTLELAMKSNLLPTQHTTTSVLVTIIENWQNAFPNALENVTKLRNARINAEIYLNPQESLTKQLKYANKKSIPYVIIQGPSEIVKQKVLLKTMSNEQQEELTIEEVIHKLLPST